MIQLSKSEMKELEKSGAQIESDRSRSVPNSAPPTAGTTQPPAPVAPKTTPKTETLDKILELVAINEQNTGVLAEIVKRMAEPKPKKSFSSTFIRDTKGNIVEATITER